MNTVATKEDSSHEPRSDSIPLPDKEQQQLAEIHRLQREDPELLAIFIYLEDGELPDDCNIA